MGALPPASGEGLGAAYARGVSTTRVVLGCGVGLLIAFGGIGVWAIPSAVACALAAIVVGRAARRRVGGITGDVLGAVEQLGEMAVLLIAAGVATGAQGVAWWR
jgi:adenosylcobinamide-GDP ribazoletransferase